MESTPSDVNLTKWKIIDLALSICKYNERHDFYDLIHNALILEPSISKKIKRLEVLAKERVIFKKKQEDWAKFSPESLRDTIIKLIESRISEIEECLKNQVISPQEERLSEFCIHSKIIFDEAIKTVDKIMPTDKVESLTPVKVRKSEVQKVEKVLSQLKHKMLLQLKKLLSEYNDIHDDIFEKLPDLYDMGSDFILDFPINEKVILPTLTKRVEIFEDKIEGEDIKETYANPLNLYLDSQISTIQDFIAPIIENLETIAYKKNWAILHNIISYDELDLIKSKVRSLNEYLIINERLSELNGSRVHIAPPQKLNNFLLKKKGLILTKEANRHYRTELTELCHSLNSENFIQKISPANFNKYFNAEVSVKPGIDWNKQIELLYFMKLLFEYKIVEEDKSNRFEALPNVFLVKGKPLRNTRSLSAQYTNLKAKFGNKKAWCVRMDSIFKTLFS